MKSLKRRLGERKDINQTPRSSLKERKLIKLKEHWDFQEKMKVLGIKNKRN